MMKLIICSEKIKKGEKFDYIKDFGSSKYIYLKRTKNNSYRKHGKKYVYVVVRHKSYRYSQPWFARKQFYYTIINVTDEKYQSLCDKHVELFI